MNSAFSRSRQRRLPARTALSCATALGLLVLAPTCGFAQPADPPDAQQRLEQERQKTRDQILARTNAQAAKPQLPEVQSRALSPDGKVAVSYSSNGTVTLWDTGTGKDLHVLAAAEPTDSLTWGHVAQFSPDGRFLLTTGTFKLPQEPGKFLTLVSQGKLWDMASGKLLWSTTDGQDDPKKGSIGDTIAWSSDGKLLATKGPYSSISLWNVVTGKVVRTLKAPFITMDAIAFSPDGKTLAGGGYHFPSYNSEIVLWDVQSGELERSFKQTDPTQGMQVQTIAFSPDGKVIALGGGLGKYEPINEISGRFNTQRGITQFWDVKSGILLSSFGYKVHRNIVTNIAFSPDGTRLASGSADQTVGLWDIDSGLLLADATCYGTRSLDKTKDGNGQGKPTGAGVKDLAFSGDGKTLDILSDDKTVRLWDVSTPSPQSDSLRHIVPNSDSRYSCFAFAPNGRSLVSGEYQNRVRFWQLDESQETDSFFAHDDPVVKVAFAPDEYRYSGKAPMLATGANLLQWKKTGENSGAGYVTGFEIKLWNSQSHELKRTLAMPGYSLTALSVSPGGRFIAAAGGRNSPPSDNVKTETGDGGFTAMVTVDGLHGPTKPEDAFRVGEGVIVLWDASTGELKQQMPIPHGVPLGLVFSPDGNTLISDGSEAGVTFWNTITGLANRTFDEDRPKPDEARSSLYFDVNGKPTLALTADGTRMARSYNGTIKFWNLETGAPPTTFTDPDEENKFSTQLIALTPDGKTLATVGPSQLLKLWDVATGKLLWKASERCLITNMEMSPDGKILATDADDGIRLWNISDVAQGVVN